MTKPTTAESGHTWSLSLLCASSENPLETTEFVGLVHLGLYRKLRIALLALIEMTGIHEVGSQLCTGLIHCCCTDTSGGSLE